MKIDKQLLLRAEAPTKNGFVKFYWAQDPGSSKRIFVKFYSIVDETNMFLVIPIVSLFTTLFNNMIRWSQGGLKGGERWC